MVALVAAIAIMMIVGTVAMQAWVDVVRRDNEAEMIFRAQDLVRALKRYQLDKSAGTGAGGLPTELKDLMEPGSKAQYFLRHLWKDPLVKDGKWGFLYAAPGGGLVDPEAPVPAEPDPRATNLPSPSLTDEKGLKDLEKSIFEKDKPGEVDKLAGLPIAGVRSLCKDKPFRVYREKTQYSEWQFTIFDLDNPQAVGGQPPTPPTTSQVPH